MKRSISILTFAAAGAATAAPAFAADLKVSYVVPKFTVAEYHAPYVAVWIENPADGSGVGTLSVRYKPNHDKWLKDMRQWWRKTGRSMTLPADGVSAATRAPGIQQFTFAGANSVLKDLKPGQYTLVVEAAREAGGYEAVRVPFTWGKPGKTATGKGTSELGAVTVAVQ